LSNLLKDAFQPTLPQKYSLGSMRFSSGLEQRNSHADVDKVYPTDLLDKVHPCDVICNCLQRFVSEARKVDGKEYPPKTLYQLLCGLLKHVKNVQCDLPDFLDRKDVRFRRLHGKCDVIFHSLHENGIGTVVQSAEKNMRKNFGRLVYSTLKHLKGLCFSMLENCVVLEEKNRDA